MTLAPALQHDRRLVAWLSLSQLISWGSIFYLFSLLMEPVERELGLSRAQSSLAFSIALLVEGLMAYPVGRWIDRGHERVVMSAGSVLAGLCLALLGSVTLHSLVGGTFTRNGTSRHCDALCHAGRAFQHCCSPHLGQYVPIQQQQVTVDLLN